MAQESEIPTEEPEEIPGEKSAEDKNDFVGTKRRSKPHPRRFGKSLRVAAAIALGSVIGPSTPQATFSIGERPPGIEAVVNTPRDLPPFPEFKSPDKEQHVLVIPLKRKGVEDIIPEDVLEQVVNESSVVYSENSQGELDYTFDVLPWQEVDNLPTENNGNHEVITGIGDDVVNNLGLPNLDQYQTRLYIIGSDNMQKWAGVALEEKNNYKRAILLANSPAHNYAHELGHTLHLGHSQLLTPAIPNNYTDGVSIVEYNGDSPMAGSLDAGIDKVFSDAFTRDKFNALERIELGWINAGEVESVKSDGVYNVGSLDVRRGPEDMPTLALRLQKPDTNERYYISYRRRNLDLEPRIDLHIWDEKLNSPTKQVAVPIPSDINPDEEFDFYDEVNGIRIKQISHDHMGVQVQVTFNKE